MTTPPPVAGDVQTVQLAASRTGRVYLAGPMTGYAEFNFPAFHAAAAALRADGIEVINPAEHGIIDGAEWADYLRFDIAKIAICESIALLPGWSKSRGATLEVHVARALGMPMMFLAGAERQAAAPSTAPAGADGWMPIETAPKDKTLLLGYFNSHGNWRTLRGQWFSQDEIDQDWEEPDLAGEGWYETPVEIDDTPNCFWTEPTHWMPLPAAPGTASAPGRLHQRAGDEGGAA